MNRKHKVMAALAAAKPTAFEPTPHPDPVLLARDLERILARPSSGRREPTPSRHVAGRRRRLAAAAMGAVLAIVAAATAVAVPVLRQAKETPAPTITVLGAAGQRPVDARQFLLAAAARASRLPAPAGAYWYQETRTSQISTLGIGGKSGRGPAYTVELSQVTRSWFGRSRSRAVTTLDKPRFLTEQDRVNWRKAGSPLLESGAPPGNRPPPSKAVNDDNAPHRFVLGGESLTMDQLRRFPIDPDRLAARLRTAIRGLLDNWRAAGASKPVPKVDAMLFEAAADLLNLPVTQEIRAAAFKVMAGVNGARLLDTITDPAGRKGTGVAFPESPHADRVFIVDQATATLLAMEYVAKDPGQLGARVPPGTAILTTTWLTTGWTDKLGQQP